MNFTSLFTKDIAIDLGTANTVILHDENIIVDEPSIIAIDRETGELKAVGKVAMNMHGRGHEKIRTIRPLRDGVIADFKSTEMMLREFIRMSVGRNRLIPPSLKMVICIPSGITEVEQRAVKDTAEQSGAKDVRMIYEPMAAAIGSGIDVLDAQGNMIIDIGGGTSEIAVISLGGIATSKSIKVAGDEFNEDIIQFMRANHNLAIGERTAEEIKINVGAAIDNLENPPVDYDVYGVDLLQGTPQKRTIGYQEVAHALEKSISKIESAVLKALSETMPELAADIFSNGIYMAGGGSLLRGLDKRISKITSLSVHVVDDPLKAVARGTSIALKNYDKFTFLIQ